MKKQKISLQKLKVNSFTPIAQNMIKGGDSEKTDHYLCTFHCYEA